MPAFPRYPFWDFSLTLYARPGVSAACLALQEQCGIDVNVLLFCLWAAVDGRAALTEEAMRVILDRAGEWHTNVVKPLRGARRRMKKGAAGVELDRVLAAREHLAAVEVECEHLEQLMIAAAAGEGTQAKMATEREKTAWANLTLYFSAAGMTHSPTTEEALQHVVRAALPASF